MSRLLDLKSPRARFARSINVERDADTAAIDGYLPVGRAIDTISRLAGALDQDHTEVALSVTGPYGSGKSSLAVVISALLGPAGDPARASAEELLGHTAPAALKALASARHHLGAERQGFIRAVVTAQREPITATVVRGLLYGTERYQPNTRQKPDHGRVVAKLRAMHEALSIGARPDSREVRAVVTALGKVAPLLLMIDEFGKNLEALTDSRSDADLFLLQELAEWTRGENRIPLALVTLQHMAFDEYADSATATQRREWAKVQGRFEDIPFVDSPSQTRALIGAAFSENHASIAAPVDAWAADQAETLAKEGLNDLADPELLARCWPLHPAALAVLPELCERYGQNERTLFSFLASREPCSVASFLAETPWEPDTTPLPVIRLDRVYDYFLASASTMAGISPAASRWIEIDTRIRDAQGVTPAALRVLKTVGLLNLVSAGGSLRASRSLLTTICVDEQDGTATPEQTQDRLAELESSGLVTFRDFADEYRVWQGSDFDIKEAIELARRRLRDELPDITMNRVYPLDPLVAARHSHSKGTLRAFDRRWTMPDVESVDTNGITDQTDGIAYYVLDTTVPTYESQHSEAARPIAFVAAADAIPLIDAAREVAAIDEVLTTFSGLTNDWVARRELAERGVEARAVLDREFELAYGTTGGHQTSWTYLRPSAPAATIEAHSASHALSEVADVWYHQAPDVRNDLINRHELSSQAAKARREVLEAMLTAPDREALGIDGNGPDNTLYRSVLQQFRLHRESGDGQWAFAEPESDSSLQPTWAYLVDTLSMATDHRLPVDEIYSRLAAPPYGLRAGLSPIILFVALIVHADEGALYEHGTFRPVLTADLAERFLRNPGNFEIKHFASRTGHRAELLTRIADKLEITAGRGPRNGRVGSVLAVVSHLVALANGLSDYAKKTTEQVDRDTRALRQELLTATEPDELVFSAIPRVLGRPPVPARGRYDPADIDAIADRLAAATNQLADAYPRLLVNIGNTVRGALRGPGPDDHARERLASRAREIQGQVIDPRITKLVVALTADIPDDDDWIEYVGMNVTGTPPRKWTDRDWSTFRTVLHDIGGAFRRVEALNADLRARGEAYDARRVTFTLPDGHESAKLVALTPAQRQAGPEILTAALGPAHAHVNSEEEARDLLLALIADAELRTQTPEVGKTATGEAYAVATDQHLREAETE